MSTAPKNITEKLDMVNVMTHLVIGGQIGALFLYGTPGVGKSWSVLEAFKSRGLVPDKDYLVVRGAVRPMSLYMLLYEHREATIVFDDSDSAWSDQDSANMLKAALELGGNRVVSYYSKAVRDAGLPTSFVFSGSVIFISNLDEDEVDPAVRSRSYAFGIFADDNDMLQLMEARLATIEDYDTMESKREALDFLKAIRPSLRSFDLRTLSKTIILKSVRPDWKELVPQFV